MAFPQPPRSYRCTQCNWSATDAAGSDIILTSTCPKCGSKVTIHLATDPLGEIHTAAAKLADKLGKMFGK